MVNTYVNEIFTSIQGEGYWTGIPAVFLRLQGCNLNCSWCDTPGTIAQGEGELRSIADVADELFRSGQTTVVVTGGEPMLQDAAVTELVLKDKSDHKWHLETNGTITIPDVFDWITISPKPGHPVREVNMQLADELKYVVTGQVDIDIAVDAMKHKRPRLKCVCLQPVDNNPRMTALCLEAIKHWGLPELRLSVQVHKLIGER